MGEIKFTEPSAIQYLGSDICERISKPLESDSHMPRYIQLQPQQLKSLKSYFKSLDKGFDRP